MTDIRTRLKQHPEQVLAEEFGRYRARLWQIVNFRLDPMLARRIDTDDVLQEAWIAALQRVPNFIENTSLSMFVWLRMVVCQTVVDVHRHHLGAQMRDAFRESPGLADEAGPSTTHSIAAKLLAQVSSPSSAMMRSELAGQLRDGIERMNSIDREVLALRHFEELSNNEVAEVLKITEKAASIRYVRAVKRLGKTLEDLSGFGGEESDARPQV